MPDTYRDVELSILRQTSNKVQIKASESYENQLQFSVALHLDQHSNWSDAYPSFLVVPCKSNFSGKYWFCKKILIRSFQWLFKRIFLDFEIVKL